jgi:hypothetical protein
MFDLVFLHLVLNRVRVDLMDFIVPLDFKQILAKFGMLGF